MAWTKMVARIVSDQRRRLLQRRQQAVQGRRTRSRIKNIEGKVRNKTFKIKRLIAVPKNVQGKKNKQVV